MSEQLVCNKCGKPFDLWDSQENFSIRKPFLGYGTKHDGETLEFHLCCACMEALIDECSVSPIVNLK